MKIETLGRGASILALTVAAMGYAPAAWAQDTAAAPQSDAATGAAQSGEEIVVTGSRLGRAGYDSPTPVNVVGEERLKQLGIPSVADALNQIPSFRAINTPASNFFRVSGNIGARTMDLRGLGATRTLTLIDGRRFVASSDNGTVDLNSIPSILVKRSEVVTGGASAAYGANAVAGVVNLILDTKLNGIKTDMNFGISQRGDGKSFYAAAAGGTDFAGGRGHIVAAFEYQKEYGLGPCETRDYCNRYTNYIANPGFVPASGNTPAHSTNGLPATLVLNDSMFVYNENGILTGAVVPLAPTAPGTNPTRALGQQVLNFGTNTELPAALRGKQFNSAGNLVPYTFGNYLSGVFQQIRDTTQPYQLGLGQQPLVVPTKHFSAVAHVDYDLTDTISATGEFMFSRVIGGPTQGAGPLDAPATLGFDNPYLSAATLNTAIAAISPLVPAGGSTATNRPKLQVNVGSYDLGPGNISKTKINTYRSMVGLKGKLFEGWDWDSYYTYGQVNARLDDQNNRAKTWNEGWDATRTGQAAIVAPNGVVMASATPSLVANGIADGTIVCRSTLTNPTNGCIPFNLLGPNSVSAAAAAQHIKPEWQTRTFTQHAAAINLRGAPFSTWAGDVKVATGGEWRRDSAVGDVDSLTKAALLDCAAANAGFISPQAVPITSATTTGKCGANTGVTIADLTVKPKPIVTKVLEGYLEASIPLLKDSPLGKQFDIDGAVRFSHYTPFGNAWTWKAGGVYSPISDITFRVTKSRDVRAPTAGELNPLATATLLPLPDPFKNNTHNQLVVTGGNPNLKLEKGDTFTAGVVLKPRFVPRFNLSLDYYNIKVKGAIDSLSGTAIANACKQLNQLCDLITFNPDGSINTVFSTFQNLSQLHAEGFELVTDYSVPVLGGNLAFQVNGNYVVDLSTTGGTGLVTQLDNWTGNNGSVTNIQGVPRWKMDGVITYSRDTWSFTMHGRYIPPAILDTTKVGPGQPGYSIDNPISQNINRVDGRFYLDLSGTLKVAETRGNGKVELYWQINNVFDKTEPAQLRLIGNPLQFDPVLRAFRFGVRTTW